MKNNQFRRVGMIVHQDYYVDGRVRNYVNFLNQSNIPVDVICVKRRSDDIPSYIEPNVNLFPIPMSRYQEKMNYFLEYFLAFWLYFFKITRLCLKNKYEVIHIHNMPDFFVFSAVIPKLFGAKLVLDIHDPMPEFYQSKYHVNEKSSWVRLLKFQEKLSVGFSSAVITANENFKDQLIHRGVLRQKITVIPNVPNPILFKGNKEKSNQDTFKLIYPGTVAPRYGLHVAIKSLALLRDLTPKIQLIIVGSSNDYTEELKELTSNMDLNDFVEFRPAVTIDRVPALLQEAQAGIYPAIPDAHLEIATPTKVQEFIAMGLPVIASRLKVMTQQFSEQAILFFEPGNVEELANQIKRLATDEHLRNQLTITARKEWAQKRNWQTEQEKYLSLISSL